jgi:hypothetical protein
MSPDPRFVINLPIDPAISATAVNPRTQATFERLFDRPQLKPFAEEVITYADYCLLLTNAASQRITGLTAIWEYPHPNQSRPSLNVRRSDSYYFGDNSKGVIPAHSEALIHPKRTIPEAVLDYEGLMFTSTDGTWNGLRDIDIMHAAPQVVVTFDTVIFEDGRVLGDDESRTVEFITNRKKAASDIVMLIRRAREDGLDIDETLMKLHEEKGGRPREDSYSFWLRTFVRQLHRVPAEDRDVSLAQYAELPELPKFRNA